jgi:hypothetical protein
MPISVREGEEVARPEPFDVKVPTAAELREYGNSLSDEQIVCKYAGGHMKVITGAIEQSTIPGHGRRLFTKIRFVCQRGCGVTWEWFVTPNSSGGVDIVAVRTYYRNSPGYLAEGLGRIEGEKKSILRGQALTRATGVNL